MFWVRTKSCVSLWESYLLYGRTYHQRGMVKGFFLPRVLVLQFRIGRIAFMKIIERGSIDWVLIVA